MKKLLPALGLLAAALAFAAGGAFAHDDGGDGGIKDHHHFGEQSLKEYQGGTKAGSAWNMKAVAQVDLKERGFNADVWQHEGYAYVGQWGFADWATGNSRFCPTDPETRGVAIIDARTPSSATWIARLIPPAGTSAEDVVVFTARYGPLAGRDIAAAGLQYCGGSRYDAGADRGLMLWDVTNPAAPKQVGYLRTACCTRGVHEFEVQHRADLGRTFAYASVPTSGYPDDQSPSGVRDVNADGDFRLFDITNPKAPFQVSDWGIAQAGGPFAGLGCDPDGNYGHGVEPSEDGTLAFVSYWDSGYVMLDLTNPANPVYRGRTVYPSNADGDAHSSQYDEGRRLLFTADEDFCKASGSGTEKGFGYMRVYDYSNPANPRQIGEYRTPNSIGVDDQAAGDYTIHNNYLVGSTMYQSWYSDGVRVVDVSNARAPREIAYFVPPANTNPVKPSQRGVLTNTTQVWGVVVDERGLVFASDMNSGLWIVKRTG
jgi:hypothetical protein